MGSSDNGNGTGNDLNNNGGGGGNSGSNANTGGQTTKQSILSDIADVSKAEVKPEQKPKEVNPKAEKARQTRDKNNQQKEEVKNSQQEFELATELNNGIIAPFVARKKGKQASIYQFTSDEKAMVRNLRPPGAYLKPGWFSYLLSLAILFCVKYLGAPFDVKQLNNSSFKKDDKQKAA